MKPVARDCARISKTPCIFYINCDESSFLLQVYLAFFINLRNNIFVPTDRINES
jgi:hypothetical protein